MVSVASPAEIPDVVALYEACNYHAAVGIADTTLICRAERQVVAAVRLVREEGVIVLRGMQVLRSHQRQGIGAALLRACIPIIEERTTYCLPYAHLVPFYRSASFRPVDESVLLSFLAARLSGYVARGQDVLAMVRDRVARAGSVAVHEARQ